MKTRLQDLIDKKTLKQINESVLGDLPSHKLMKMKWNPVTGKKAVKEANSDGTISPDEDKKRADMLKKFESELNKVVNKYIKQADKIGGPFRKDGIKAEMSKIMKRWGSTPGTFKYQ